MALSLDPATRLISVPQADLTFVSGTLYELDTNQFRKDVMALLASQSYIWMPDAFQHNGEVTVAGTTFARTLEFINSYSVQFENTGSAYSVRLIGSNNNIFDIDNGILTPTPLVTVISTNSAGLITQQQILEMHGQIQREVWLDPTLGTDGNGYQQSPFNSLTSAIDYAEANGITGLVLLGDITLNRNLKNFQVRGVGRPTIDFAGFDLAGGTFKNVQLEGNYTSDILALECNLKTNARLSGEFRDCSLGGDLFCVAGATILLKNCSSSVAGLGRPTITMSNGGARVLLSVRSNNGGLTIKGSTHADDEVTVEVNRGSLTFDSSNTAGTMVARTSGKFVDQTAGATVTREIYAQEAWERLDLDSTKNNIYADDGTQITGSDWTLTRTDNGNGTSTVARS